MARDHEDGIIQVWVCAVCSRSISVTGLGVLISNAEVWCIAGVSLIISIPSH
jgi:hypothetical protein